MNHLVQPYEKNRQLIRKFIISSLRRLDLKKATSSTFKELNESFPSLELMYECDTGFVQTSPNIGKDLEELEQIGKKRHYLVDEGVFENTNYFVSEPYISSATGCLCITVIHKHEGGYIFFDFKVRTLLERFHMIEEDTGFRQLSRFSYALIGGGLLVLGLFVAIYGLVSFGLYLFSDAAMDLEVVFKPVIALTLGLAVFDLGKTIFEQEVLPRTQNISEVFNPKSLITFMSSIMIALLIEALLIVFKISINNYHDLPYAASLILAISLLLFVFSRFVYSGKKEGVDAEVLKEKNIDL